MGQPVLTSAGLRGEKNEFSSVCEEHNNSVTSWSEFSSAERTSNSIRRPLGNTGPEQPAHPSYACAPRNRELPHDPEAVGIREVTFESGEHGIEDGSGRLGRERRRLGWENHVPGRVELEGPLRGTHRRVRTALS